MSDKPSIADLYRHILFDPDLALRNAVANQALEGQHMTASEIERSRKIISGEITIDEAVAPTNSIALM